MKVEGPGFFGYDKQHLKVTRRIGPESVKPNIFKNTSEDVSMALLLSDAVSLSPEAQILLKKLKAKLDDAKEELKSYLDDDEFLANFNKLKALVKEKSFTKTKKYQEPAHNIDIQIGKGERQKNKNTFEHTPLREKIEKMVVYSSDEMKKRQLVKEIEVLGDSIISACKQFGVRIFILKRDEAITDLKIAGISVIGKGEKSFDGRSWETIRGLYDQERRIIVIGEEQLGHSNRSTARHELAHAYDHTFTHKNQRRLPLSVQLWNLFRGERKELVSDYAGTNPAEYFAECVEEFFNPDGFERVKIKDPRMFEYLSNLFQL